MKLLAIKIGFLGKFLLELKWWYTVQWFKSPHNEEEEILLSRHLVTSLGIVPKKSWDSAVWGRSWDGAVLGQSWARSVLVRSWDSTLLGRYGLGTVQSWDGAVVGHWSWDSGLGTVVLGHWSWDSGLCSSLKTVVLGQKSWGSGLGTVILRQ